MKAAITLLMLLSGLNLMASETDSTRIHKMKVNHELFINTTYFLKQVISLSNSNLEISPYIIGYKCYPSKHHGIRLSFGGNWSSSKKFPDSTFVVINKQSDFAYRVGYEYHLSIGKMWRFFAGFDINNEFTSSSNKTNSNTDIITTSSKGVGIGGGPVVGIQINLHKRIALFTETAFYYNYMSTRSKTTSLNFPELNVQRGDEIEQKAAFLLPTSIYFVFKF